MVRVLETRDDFQPAIEDCRRRGGRTFVNFECQTNMQAGVACEETCEAFVYRRSSIARREAFDGFETRAGRERVARYLSHGEGHGPAREGGCDLCLAETVLLS